MGTTKNSVNAFSQFVCGYEGKATVVEKSSDKKTKTYSKAHIQLDTNPYLNDQNIPHFVMNISKCDPPNSCNILSIWMPHDVGKNVTQMDKTTIKFDNFYQMPLHGRDLVTFIFEFASDEYYWPGDDIGSETEGWIKPTFGSMEGVIVDGSTAEANLEQFLKNIRPVTGEQ